jgi:hypothetical protein
VLRHGRQRRAYHRATHDQCNRPRASPRRRHQLQHGICALDCRHCIAGGGVPASNPRRLHRPQRHVPRRRPEAAPAARGYAATGAAAFHAHPLSCQILTQTIARPQRPIAATAHLRADTCAPRRQTRAHVPDSHRRRLPGLAKPTRPRTAVSSRRQRPSAPPPRAPRRPPAMRLANGSFITIQTTHDDCSLRRHRGTAPPAPATPAPGARARPRHVRTALQATQADCARRAAPSAVWPAAHDVRATGEIGACCIPAQRRGVRK